MGIQEIDGMLEEFQSKILDQDVSIDDKKTAAEAYKILSQQKLEIQKAETDSEFRESEMVLKEDAAKLEAKKFDEELKRNEREAKLKKLESGVKTLETVAKIGTGVGGMILYELNFKKLLFNETQTLNVIPQRPFMYLKGLEKLAINGVSAVLRL